MTFHLSLLAVAAVGAIVFVAPTGELKKLGLVAFGAGLLAFLMGK